MPAPGLKEMAHSRELKLGHFIVEFATPGIGQILKAAGCDFTLFDTEHSGFGFETIKSVLRYMQAADLPTIVRVPSKEYHHIARAADMGAEGIMLPMVGSAEEARHILDCMKYVPVGRRGVALGIAHDRYLPGPTMEKLAEANRRTTLFAQIETREGVDNADFDRRGRWRRLPLGRPFRPELLARHPGAVRPQGLHRRDRHGRQGLQEARQEPRAPRADRRRCGRAASARASTSSAIPATSGRCTGRSMRACARSGTDRKAGDREAVGQSARQRPRRQKKRKK